MPEAAFGEAMAPRGWRRPAGPQLVQWLCGGWTALVFAFLYVPIILLIVFSFNASRIGVRWTGFTTEWYGVLLRNRVLLDAFQNSLIVAVATTLLATALGTIGAWLLFRYRFPWRRALGLLIFIPMVMPEVLMGVSLMALFVRSDLPLGFGSLIVSHTTFCFPFVLVAVQAARGHRSVFEEAAMDLGATPVQAFWRVIVPYLLPAIISGALMSFTLSFDEYIVSSFLASTDSQTLPLKVYGMAKKGLSPELNALSTLFVAGTLLLVLASQFIQRKHR